MNGMVVVFGLNFGSFLFDWIGFWYWLFLINLLIVVLLVVFGVCFIVEIKVFEVKCFDMVGIFFLFLLILVVMYGMMNFDVVNFLNSLGDLEVYGCIVFGIFCFVVFILFEKRVEMWGGDLILVYFLLWNYIF